jgi:hypothetical protein
VVSTQSTTRYYLTIFFFFFFFEKQLKYNFLENTYSPVRRKSEKNLLAPKDSDYENRKEKHCVCPSKIM